MANAQTFYQLRTSLAYKGVAATDANNANPIEYTAGRYEQASDGMSLSLNAALNTATAVKASAGKVYEVIVESPSAATAGCTVQLFDLAAASVTLGTTVPKDLVFCPAGETVVINVCSGGSANRYAAAIAVAATAATSLSAAADSANRPTVTVLYA